MSLAPCLTSSKKTFMPMEKFPLQMRPMPPFFAMPATSSMRSYHPVVPTTMSTPQDATALMLSTTADGRVKSIATSAPFSASFETAR